MRDFRKKIPEEIPEENKRPNGPIRRAHGIMVLNMAKNPYESPDLVYQCRMCQKGYRDVNHLFAHMSASPMCQKDYILPEIEPEAKKCVSSQTKHIPKKSIFKCLDVQSKSAIKKAKHHTTHKFRSHSKPRHIPNGARRFTEVMTKASKDMLNITVKCQSCNKFLNSADSLKVHMGTHYVDPIVREKALKCNNCQEEFVDDFIKLVHTQRDQCKKRCAKCVQGFDTSAQLTRHLACHQSSTDEKL